MFVGMVKNWSLGQRLLNCRSDKQYLRGCVRPEVWLTSCTRVAGDVLAPSMWQQLYVHWQASSTAVGGRVASQVLEEKDRDCKDHAGITTPL